MKKIFGALDEVKAGLIETMLDQADIAFSIRNRYLSGALGELPATECWPEIWIHDDNDYEQALGIVELAVSEVGGGAGPWKCQCGETNEGQFASCWNCGSDRPDTD